MLLQNSVLCHCRIQSYANAELNICIQALATSEDSTYTHNTDAAAEIKPPVDERLLLNSEYFIETMPISSDVVSCYVYSIYI